MKRVYFKMHARKNCQLFRSATAWHSLYRRSLNSRRDCGRCAALGAFAVSVLVRWGAGQWERDIRQQSGAAASIGLGHTGGLAVRASFEPLRRSLDRTRRGVARVHAGSPAEVTHGDADEVVRFRLLANVVE